MKPLFIGTYARYAFIINFLKNKKYKNIIEIGSGLFGISNYYNVSFTGLDNTTQTINKKRSKKMKFKYGNALKIKEKDNSYDFVFSTDMIEHIDSKKRIIAIKEMIRISSDICVIGFPCGKLAQIHDDFWYHYFCATDKDWKKGRHARLVEHIEKGLPTEEDLNDITKELRKGKIHFDVVRYNDILGWKNIISIEMALIKLGYVGLGLSTMLTFIVKLFKMSFKSKPFKGYRVFLVIYKKQANQVLAK